MAIQKLAGQQTLEMLRDRIFNLEEFVVICNRWLWEYIPENYQGTRAKEPISSRNIRHYASENLLDEPLKAGKEARYAYRHLIQVLLIRRASAEGYTSKLMYSILQQDTDQLERLLNGDLPSLVRPERISQNRSVEAYQSQNRVVLPSTSHMISPASPTREQAQSPASELAQSPASERARSPTQELVQEEAQPAPSSAQREVLDYLAGLSTSRKRSEASNLKQQSSQHWQQFELETGIELWLRQDAQKPRTELERQRLLGVIETILKS